MINREPILHELENVTLERIQKEFYNELKNNKRKYLLNIAVCCSLIQLRNI